MMATRIVKCPKCKQSPLLFREIWTSFGIEFYVADDGTAELEGCKTDGVPDNVEAECNCGHCWRVRGVTQITELQPVEGGE